MDSGGVVAGGQTASLQQRLPRRHVCDVEQYAVPEVSAVESQRGVRRGVLGCAVVASQKAPVCVGGCGEIVHRQFDEGHDRFRLRRVSGMSTALLVRCHEPQMHS
ncbi:Uncharacterised protein [Mycobacteroides abscessus subsp. abscessus]|nr:Uncharacterised protein [Mycobacteroides abscessus subsp. abscessus]